MSSLPAIRSGARLPRSFSPLTRAPCKTSPGRFRRSRDVGAYLGLTPKRYQSGERDVSERISRQGDAMARHYLYEAANCLLTTWSGRSALKSWGLGLVRRIGAKKARVVVARKLACLLLRLWKDASHYQEEMRMA